MSHKYPSQDLHIIRRRLESGGNVWMFGLIHELKRRGIFYHWLPGCTHAVKLSNLLLNDPNTLRQRHIATISMPHLDDFLEVMKVDWQDEGAEDDKHFIELALIHLEQRRLVPDGTQLHWTNLLDRDFALGSSSESSSLPSSVDGDDDFGPLGHNPLSIGSQQNRYFPSPAANRSTYPPAAGGRPLGLGTKPDQSARKSPPGSSDQHIHGSSPARTNWGATQSRSAKRNQGVKRAPLAREDRSGKRDLPKDA